MGKYVDVKMVVSIALGSVLAVYLNRFIPPQSA